MSLTEILQYGNTQKTHQLLSKGKLTKKHLLKNDKDGKSLLHKVCLYGHDKIVKLLIDMLYLNNADIMMPDTYGNNCIHLICNSMVDITHFSDQYCKILQLFIDKCQLKKEDMMIVNSAHYTALQYICTYNGCKINEILFDKMQLSKEDFITSYDEQHIKSPLENACINNNLEVVKLIIETICFSIK